MLSNPDFEGQFDLCPYIDLDAHGKCWWNNVMLGNLAWRCSVSVSVLLLLGNMSLWCCIQVDIFASDPTTEGSMLCPIILGSDKTTVTVATGHVEYHPLYLSIGNPHNAVRHAHWNAVIPITFLAIPKCKLLLIIIHIGALMSETQVNADMMIAQGSRHSNASYTIHLLWQSYGHYTQAWRSPWFVDVQMATSDVLFMTLSHILPITQSKWCLLASFKAGAPSE